MSEQGQSQTRSEKIRVLLYESPDVKLDDLKDIITGTYEVLSASDLKTALELLREPSVPITVGIFYINVAESLLRTIRNFAGSYCN